jgi:hypothetical protein
MSAKYCICGPRGGARGVERGQVPPSPPKKFFYSLNFFFFNILVAHPQSLIKGQIIFQK